MLYFQLENLTKNDLCETIIFVIGENGFELAKSCDTKIPVVKVGNWIGPLLVKAAINNIKTVILFGYHGKLIKLAGGIFNTHNHLADARIEILVYLAVEEKLPSEIISKLAKNSTIEDCYLLLEKLDESLANRLWKKLSKTIEKRSMEYVNRYIKTDMQIATVIFDRQRQIRWFGSLGEKYISIFHKP